MAAAIGLAVIAGQGWLWLLPLLLFLGSGVLLGRLNRNARTDAKHGKPRDAMQVFCSGGLYALLAINDDFNADIWMSVSICVAMCDTWASEIGMYASGRTWNMVTFRKVQPGLSGGVSVAGLVGGLIGSVLMGGLCSALIFHGFEREFYFGIACILAGAGIIGMLLDSLLGALVQVKYNDGHGLSDSGSKHAGGARWITNDLVNLLSNAAVVALAVALSLT